MSYAVETCNKGGATMTPVLIGLFYNRAANPTCSDTAEDSYTITAGLAASACDTLDKPAVTGDYFPAGETDNASDGHVTPSADMGTSASGGVALVPWRRGTTRRWVYCWD